MTHLFDEATSLVDVGNGRYRGEVGDEWSIAGVPNGGLLMGAALRGALAATGAFDPLTMTTHFLSASSPGPFDLVVDVVKQGRRFSTASVALVQEDRERSRSLITLGDLSTMSGPTVSRLQPPDVDEGIAVTGGAPVGFVRMAERFEFRVPEIFSWANDSPTGEPEIHGQIRFADGREPDLVSAPLLLDAFPPTTFQLEEVGWSPTLEMTVHFRARPAPGWCTGALEARNIVAGLFEEDGVLWDSTGTVVAMSRQLAMLPA